MNNKTNICNSLVFTWSLSYRQFRYWYLNSCLSMGSLLCSPFVRKQLTDFNETLYNCYIDPKEVRKSAVRYLVTKQRNLILITWEGILFALQKQFFSWAVEVLDGSVDNHSKKSMYKILSAQINVFFKMQLTDQ